MPCCEASNELLCFTAFGERSKKTKASPEAMASKRVAKRLAFLLRKKQASKSFA
jgi:hypothetical protein